jgi:hypothetical protein
MKSHGKINDHILYNVFLLLLYLKKHFLTLKIASDWLHILQLKDVQHIKSDPNAQPVFALSAPEYFAMQMAALHQIDNIYCFHNRENRPP